VTRFLDPASRSAAAGRARAHVLARFDKGRLVRDIERLYRELLADA
jgi:hypothetical protein